MKFCISVPNGNNIMNGTKSLDAHYLQYPCEIIRKLN